MAISETVPADIRRKLSAMLWRARLLALVRGLAVVVGAILAAILVGVGVDQFVMGHIERCVIVYEWPVRLAVTLGILGIALATTVLAVVRPLIRRFTDAGIAQTIEGAHPELEERLSSTVELLSSSEPAVIRGSQEMIEILTEQAMVGARRLRLQGVIHWDRAARYWAVTALTGLAMFAVAARWPDQFSLSLRRLLLANLERVGQTKVIILGEMDRVVPEGEPVLIRAETRGRTRPSAWLLLRGGGKRLETVEMAPAQDQPDVFTCTIPRVVGPLQYQVRAGDGHTRWCSLTGVQRPRVVGINARIHPPAYSGRPLKALRNLGDELKVLRHSRIELAVATNKPVAHAALQIEPDRSVELASGGENLCTTSLTALEDITFRVLLVDEYRLDNVSPTRHHVAVLRDEPPSVTILQPGRRVTLKATDRLPIRFAAHDDMAVTTAELLVSAGMDEPTALPIALPQPNQPSAEAETILDLAKLGLINVRQLNYRIRVFDSLPGELDNGPQVGLSASHEIIIDAAAQTFKMQVLQNVRKQFQSAIAQIGQLLEASKKQTASIRAADAKKQEYTSELAAQTDAARQTLRKAESVAREISELTAYTDYRGLAETLETDVAKGHIAPAEQLLSEAKLLTTQPAERADRFARAEYEIQRAQAQLAMLAKQFDDSSIYQESAQALADAAARQADLAERMAQLSEPATPMAPADRASTQATTLPGDDQPVPEGTQRFPGRLSISSRPAGPASRPSPAELARLTKEQEELIRATRELVASHPQMLQPVLQAQQARSKTLLEEIGELIARQDQLAKLVHNQQERDKARANREQLAKAQADLTAQAAKLAKEKAGLLAEANAPSVDLEKMSHGATRIQEEHFPDATEDQAQSAAELAAVAKAAAAATRKITASAPNPQPHHQLATSARELASQATGLAQQQRQLAGQTGGVAQQREVQRRSLSEAEGKLQQQIADLTKRQEALGADAESLAAKMVDRPPLSVPMKTAITRLNLAPTTRQAVQHLGGKRLDQAQAAQQAVAGKLGELGKAVADQADRARQEQKRFTGEMDKWNVAEAQRQAAVKAYQDELTRREQAMQKWQTDETARKAALNARRSVQEAGRKNPPATQAASRPATTQQVSSKPATPTEPPKELATAISQPTFPALTRPPDRPATKPQPASPIWDEAQLRLADSAAAGAAGMVKRQQELQGQATNLAKAAKETADRRAAANRQTDQEDASLQTRQQELRQAAVRIQAQAARTSPDARKLGETEDPGRSMQEAAGAIKNHELTSAVKVQEKAAGELDALAKALHAESEKATSAAAAAASAAAETQRQATAQQQLAEAANQLHQQQNQLRAQTTAVGRQLAPLGATVHDRLLVDLLKQQQELANQAAGLADELARPQQASGAEMPARPDPVAQTTAMEAEKASQALEEMVAKKTLGNSTARPPAPKGTEKARAPADAVADLQNHVVGKLEQLVRRLQEPVEEDPANWERQATQQYLRSQHADRAADLADWQRRLKTQLEKVLDGKPMPAVALEQDALRKKVTSLAHAAEFLKEQIETEGKRAPVIKPELLANATKAAELLRQVAPAAMDRATKALNQESAATALPPMNEAHKALADAHRLLGTLQGQLAKAADQVPAPSQTEEQLSKQLTQSLQDQYEALWAMLEAQQATAEGVANPAEAAARAFQADLAAQAARAAANANVARMQASARDFMEAARQAAGQKDIEPSRMVVLPGAPTGAGNWQLVIPDLKTLDFEMLGLTRTDWARLPGVIRDEIIQAAEDKSPTEYRELIKRYFKAISQRSGGRGDRPLLDDTRPIPQPPTPGVKGGKPK